MNKRETIGEKAFKEIKNEEKQKSRLNKRMTMGEDAFKKAENNENRSEEFHGNFGPLEVSNQKAAKPISHA